MSSNVVEVSDDSFEADVISAQMPVVVDFWAVWCGPCKALAPALEEIAQKYNGQVKFVKMDVEANPSIPPKFGVRSIPTVMVFKDGQVLGSQVGFRDKASLAEFISTHTA